MANKMGKSTLVKIDANLYGAVRAFVEKNKLEFSSIKHFIDQAVMKAMGFRQYDIAGIEENYNEELPLKKLVGESKKGFFLCNMCNKPFLRNRLNNSEESKICSNCKDAIKHFAPKLRGEHK